MLRKINRNGIALGAGKSNNLVMRDVEPLSTEARSLKPGIYEHFKGNRYEVLGVARHSETLEELVVYRALYGDHALWVRPLKMFTETVEHDGKTVQRFRYIGEVNNE